MAKDRVEGKIGDEDVVLNNAATESTLENLLDQMKKMAKAQGLSESESKKNRDAVKEYNKSLNKATKSTGGLVEEIDNSTNALQDFRSGLGKVGGALGLLTRGVSSLVSGTYNLAESFMLGGDRLSDFLGGIPVFGTVSRALDDNIDVYRNISSVGASFGNSLQDMRLAAATARVSLESFQQLVSNNSETLAIFGDSVSSGARRFAEFSGNFRQSDIGQRFMGMGFTIEDLNDRLAGYIELEARRDRLERLSTDQLTRGAENYLDQLDKLAKVTGMERKEAEELILKQQQEANIRAMSNKLQGEQREQFENNIAMFESLTPSYATAFKDLIDGAAQTEEAQSLLAGLGPAAGPFMEMMRDVGRGRIPVEDTLNALATTYGPQLEQTLNGVGETVAQQLMLSGDPLGAALSSLGELLRLNNDRLGEVAGEEQDNRNAITERLGAFQQTIQSIRNTILSTFLESDAFKGVTDTLEKFSQDILSSERIKQILDENVVPALRRFDNWLTSFFRDVQDPDTTFFEALGNAMDPVMEFIKEKFNNLFTRLQNFFLGREIEGPLRLGEERQRAEGWYETSGLKSIFETMANDIVAMFSDALFGRKLTEDEQFTDAERRRRNELATIPSFRRTDEQKEEFGILEEKRKRNEAIQKGLVGRAPLTRGRGEERGLTDFFSFNTGTQGIRDFGSGEPAMLHGREAVLTEDQLFRMANGAYSIGTQQMSQARISSAISSAFESGSTITSNINQRQLDKLPNTIKELKAAIQELKPETNQTLDGSQETTPRTQTTNQTDLGRKLDQLNNTMESVVGILADTHNLSKRQLQSYNGLSGNLQRGIA